MSNILNSKNFNYFQSVKLADNLYSYIWQGNGNNCNSCLFTNVLEGSEPHIIIDPGHVQDELGEDCFNFLTDAIEKDGFKIEDIGLIINTHSHTDHCQSNPIITAKSKAKIALSEEEEKFRHTGGKLLDAMFGIKPTVFTTDIYLKEGKLTTDHFKLTIDLQISLCPGHSPGSVCIYWPEKKILITGDVVFYGSVGRTDFPGGNVDILKESINKLKQLDIEYLVPGHSTEMGSVIEGKEKVEQNFRMIQYYFQD